MDGFLSFGHEKENKQWGRIIVGQIKTEKVKEIIPEILHGSERKVQPYSISNSEWKTQCIKWGVENERGGEGFYDSTVRGRKRRVEGVIYILRGVLINGGVYISIYI